jgi:hypothetical protein
MVRKQRTNFGFGRKLSRSTFLSVAESTDIRNPNGASGRRGRILRTDEFSFRDSSGNSY